VLSRVAIAALTACAANAPQPVSAPCQGPAEVRSTAGAEALGACDLLPALAVSGGSRIDLESLETLGVVSGDLVVGPSSQLSSLGGLRGLKTVTGDVVIESNFQLSGVFLSTLDSIGGDLTIRSNASIGSVSLPSLRAIAGSLEITENGSLEAVIAPALRDVGGNLEITAPRVSILELQAEIVVRGTTHIDVANQPIPVTETTADPHSPTRSLPE